MELDYPEDQIRMTLDVRPDEVREGVRLHEIVLQPGQTAWAPGGGHVDAEDDRVAVLYSQHPDGEITMQPRKVEA